MRIVAGYIPALLIAIMGGALCLRRPSIMSYVSTNILLAGAVTGASSLGPPGDLLHRGVAITMVGFVSLAVTPLAWDISARHRGAESRKGRDSSGNSDTPAS